VGYSPYNQDVKIEAEESPLLRALAKQRLVKTLQAGEDLACSDLKSVEISDRVICSYYLYAVNNSNIQSIFFLWSPLNRDNMHQSLSTCCSKVTVTVRSHVSQETFLYDVCMQKILKLRTNRIGFNLHVGKPSETTCSE
jgi:hypothetical protein